MQIDMYGVGMNNKNDKEVNKLLKTYAIISNRYIFANKHHLKEDGLDRDILTDVLVDLEKQLLTAGFKFPKVKVDV
jgi:hypothetical protein